MALTISGETPLTTGGAIWSNSNSGGFSIGASADVNLVRDAANALALRNGTTAQGFFVYNTYTSGSNYERGFAQWVGNTFQLGMATVGGSARTVQVTTGGVAFNFTNNGFLTVPNTGGYAWSGRSALLSPADGTVRLVNDAQTNTVDFVLGSSNTVRINSAQLIGSTVALTNGAAAQVGTLTNAPAAGNPTKWIPINDNGTTRYIPAW